MGTAATETIRLLLENLGDLVSIWDIDGAHTLTRLLTTYSIASGRQQAALPHVSEMFIAEGMAEEEKLTSNLLYFVTPHAGLGPNLPYLCGTFGNPQLLKLEC